MTCAVLYLLGLSFSLWCARRFVASMSSGFPAPLSSPSCQSRFSSLMASLCKARRAFH